jgi:hypothetical protein
MRSKSMRANWCALFHRGAESRRRPLGGGNQPHDGFAGRLSTNPAFPLDAKQLVRIVARMAAVLREPAVSAVGATGSYPEPALASEIF